MTNLPRTSSATASKQRRDARRARQAATLPQLSDPGARTGAEIILTSAVIQRRGVSRTLKAMALLSQPGMWTRLPRRQARQAESTAHCALGNGMRNSPERCIVAVSWKPERIGPGHSAITRTPRGPSSSAMASENDST